MTNRKENQRTLFSPQNEIGAYLSNYNGSTSQVSSSKETLKLREQIKAQVMQDVEIQR
jgi:hypothetical protein